MNQQAAPAVLSVVVVSFNALPLLERCLSALECQTTQPAIEIIVVRHPEIDQRELEVLKRRFQRVLWVCAPVDFNVPRMRRLGMDQSTSEIIALLEDDCVPTETWVAKLQKAHQGDVAAVGGAVEPNQYTKRLDWALYFCEYGQYMNPLPEGTAVGLPGANVSYKRSALRQLSDDCELDEGDPERDGFYEVFVHQKLTRSGRTMKADPGLVVHNVNTWKFPIALKSRFHHGRGFASMRVADRPHWVRPLFLGLAILLPVVQVGRIVRQVMARRRHRLNMVQALPWIILISASWSTGEFAGYLLGPGKSLGQWR